MSAGEPLVLIVDDTPENLRVLASILSEADYAFSFAQSGQEAVAVVQSSAPDLILMDVSMPGMDGFEACRQLKADPRTRNIPVIFLTARVEAGDVLRGFEAGGVDYVTKPFQARELLSRVRTHLDLKFARETLSTSLEERNAMLHILCHDLGNPLAIIRGYTEILAENPDFLSKAIKPLLTAGAQGLAIIELIRGLLSVEHHKLDLEPVDLLQAVETSLTLTGPMLEKKGITLQISIEAGLLVSSEPTVLVNSILNNILTNAAKFSETGGEVSLIARREGSEVVLSCRDQGIGMPAEMLTQVFDLSRRTSRLGTAGEKGTGFGMPLIKRFIEASGGRVEIESTEKNAGTTMHGTTITLRFQAARI